MHPARFAVNDVCAAVYFVAVRFVSQHKIISEFMISVPHKKFFRKQIWHTENIARDLD